MLRVATLLVLLFVVCSHAEETLELTQRQSDDYCGQDGMYILPLDASY
jgi:hypothetical protein